MSNKKNILLLLVFIIVVLCLGYFIFANQNTDKIVINKSVEKELSNILEEVEKIESLRAKLQLMSFKYKKEKAQLIEDVTYKKISQEEYNKKRKELEESFDKNAQKIQDEITKLESL